jgi:uncharacterized alpha-E superfamily protein
VTGKNDEKPLLSRVADAMYWMNRYVERAENVARFVDVNLHWVLDSPSSGSLDPWASLVAASGDHALFSERYGAPTPDAVLRFLTLDAQNPNSILSCLRAARENARSVREVISSEMWRQLNELHLAVSECGRNPELVLGTPGDFFDRLKRDCHAFVGITYLTMTHNEAWHFGRLGRLLERADKTSRIVDVKGFLLLASAREPDAIDEIQWSALLKSASAFEMYRKRHGRVTPNDVIDFLLLEAKFPRSIRYCLTKAERSIYAITGSPWGLGPSSAERELGELRRRIDAAESAAILEAGLHEWIDDVQTRINRVGEAVFETFFSQRPVSSRERSVLPPPPSQSQSQ